MAPIRCALDISPSKRSHGEARAPAAPEPGLGHAPQNQAHARCPSLAWATHTPRLTTAAGGREPSVPPPRLRASRVTPSQVAETASVPAGTIVDFEWGAMASRSFRSRFRVPTDAARPSPVHGGLPVPVTGLYGQACGLPMAPTHRAPELPPCRTTPSAPARAPW